MSYRADPTFLTELKQYGDVNIESCFNCGNCTAICPLSTEDESFPRVVIRYAQLGLRDNLLSERELWMCYYCGECTTTCPRKANPGGFMATARRYAIANYDVTGLAKLMYKSPWFNVLLTIVLFLIFSAFILSFREPVPAGGLALWEFIPEVYIQLAGLLVVVFMGLVSVIGMVKMGKQISKPWRAENPYSGEKNTKLNWWGALWDTIVVEVLGEKRYRTDDCEQDQQTPWYLRSWAVHLAILYGFIGLFAATALDFLFKPVETSVPLYYPMRLLGTLAGLLMMYGITVAMIHRLQKRDESTSDSHFSDWTFLILIWLVGLSGFLLEIAVYNIFPVDWGYALLIIHVALVMVLFVLLPLSKFAHMLYRTTALYFHNLKHVEQAEEQLLAPTGD